MEKGLKAHFAHVPIGLGDAQNLPREVAVTGSCCHLPPLLWGQGAGLQLRFQWLLWLFAMGNDKTIVSLRTQFGAHGKVPAEAG